ncbi:MAG: dephospho-CoA kinase [Burkholderiales bacterium]|nr:dephospho-CoA kinase [Burkholderiales bacterium]
MFTLGLTGGIGSGKSTVANMFARLGTAIVDTDLIAHQLTTTGGKALPAIRAQFGAAYIAADGAMDRAAMRRHVFSDPAERQKLEAILHPLIRQETEIAAQNTEAAYLIFVVPLLVESGNWKNRVHRVLVVDCDEATQLQRVMTRNGLSEAQVKAIMETQAGRQQRLQAADDVIVNEGDLSGVEARVMQLHRHYLQMAGTMREK